MNHGYPIYMTKRTSFLLARSNVEFYGCSLRCDRHVILQWYQMHRVPLRPAVLGLAGHAASFDYGHDQCSVVAADPQAAGVSLWFHLVSTHHSTFCRYVSTSRPCCLLISLNLSCGGLRSSSLLALHACSEPRSTSC